MPRYSNTMIGGYGMNKARRDGRNPYGSRGGYVDSRGDSRDYNRDYGDYRDRDYRDYRDYRGGSDYDYRDGNDFADYDYQQDMDMRSRGYDQGMDGHDPGYARGFAGHYGNTPFEVMQTGQFQTGHLHDMRDYGDYGDYRDYGDSRGRRDYGDYNDYRRDYQGSKMLERKDLEMWSQKLMQKVDEKEKETFKKEKILKKAEEMGIRFDKFSPEEFYTCVLMMYTDYCKTLGNANIDLYIKMAKDFLTDDDAKVKNAEKLAAYYNNIVKP